MLRQILTGAAAGAAGTTALNGVSYLDMAVRARPTSSTPQDTVERLVGKLPVDVPGEGEDRDNRVSGIGPLLGLATGIGVGALYGAVTSLTGRPRVGAGALAATAAVLVGSNGPMAALGVSDPREWDANAWLSDVIPHLAYGLVTALTYEATQAR
ncbi:MAG: hypothetical protein H0U36_09845 [Nocardioidaceae bacterium]|nr:hypothetical protein [Nocardioidaceae bacterium]